LEIEMSDASMPHCEQCGEAEYACNCHKDECCICPAPPFIQTDAVEMLIVLK
jgi:hypothetical protein